MQPQYITPTSPQFIDLTGQRFGQLVALGVIARTRRGALLWHCRCDCGNDKNVLSYSLRHGETKSCGCKSPNRAIPTKDKFRLRHGKSRSSAYRVWLGIITRCCNTGDRAYRNYGARGIRICDEWRNSFESFYAYVGDPPAGLSLDRIDNNGNYEPGNVRWATMEVQRHNSRQNVHLTWNGKTQDVTQWANELGMSRHAIYSRLYMGWTAERALTTPVKHHARGNGRQNAG